MVLIWNQIFKHSPFAHFYTGPLVTEGTLSADGYFLSASPRFHEQKFWMLKAEALKKKSVHLKLKCTKVETSWVYS